MTAKGASHCLLKIQPSISSFVWYVLNVRSKKIRSFSCGKNYKLLNYQRGAHLSLSLSPFSCLCYPLSVSLLSWRKHSELIPAVEMIWDRLHEAQEALSEGWLFWRSKVHTLWLMENWFSWHPLAFVECLMSSWVQKKWAHTCFIGACQFWSPLSRESEYINKCLQYISRKCPDKGPRILQVDVSNVLGSEGKLL